MTDYEKIEELARQNNNVFKTQMVIEAGIRKEKIREMLEHGLVEKLGHGLYSLSREEVDEYYEFQQRCPKGIFSYGTSAYFWNRRVMGFSGFAKTDKLQPVITITVYWGSGAWDGARSLHEMLDVPDKKLLRFISNYRMNLIVPDEITDFNKFQTELGTDFKSLFKGTAPFYQKFIR